MLGQPVATQSRRVSRTPPQKRSGATALEQSTAVFGANTSATFAAAASADAVQSHLRGSSLLFVGRLLSKWLNFAVQVLVVRLLSQADYGALAYVLSIVALLQQASTLGLDQSVTRFLPMYHDQRRYDKLFGAILMSLGIVSLLGLTLTAATFLGRDLLAHLVVRDERVLMLLLVLAFLTPLQAIDNVLVGMFAVLANPATIFVRRHVLAPGLKLVAILVVMLCGAGVFQVAIGYLIAELVGLAIGAAILCNVLRRQKLITHFDWQHLRMPWKEILAYTIPLFSSELLILIVPVIEVVLLERFSDVSQIAAYRVVVPLAILIGLVKASFTPLFMPTAARMLARNDHDGLNALYWQTTIWLSLLSYPIFITFFAAAEPVTVLLYGTRYASSAVLLMWITLGEYVDAAIGINALALKAYGRMKYVLLVNAATLIINLAASLTLVPAYGALGAAIATSLTWIGHALLNHGCLAWKTGIRAIGPGSIRVYATIVLATCTVWLIQRAVALPSFAGVVLAAMASLVVLQRNHRLLRANEIFPETERIPLLRWILKP